MGRRNLFITTGFLSFKTCSLLDTHIFWIREYRNVGRKWIDCLSWLDVCFTRPKSVPGFFSPLGYLAFHIASEQHSALVKWDWLLFPNDNLEWLLCHFAEVSERQRIAYDYIADHCITTYFTHSPMVWLSTMLFWSTPYSLSLGAVWLLALITWVGGHSLDVGP